MLRRDFLKTIVAASVLLPLSAPEARDAHWMDGAEDVIRLTCDYEHFHCEDLIFYANNAIHCFSLCNSEGCFVTYFADGNYAGGPAVPSDFEQIVARYPVSGEIRWYQIELRRYVEFHPKYKPFEVAQWNRMNEEMAQRHAARRKAKEPVPA